MRVILRALFPNLVYMMLFFGAPSAVVAHHSDSQFDKTKFLSFDAVVTRFVWKNPHVFVRVEVQDANGNTFETQIEGDGISVLKPHGWERDSLGAGDRVTVEVHPPRDSARNSFLGLTVTKVDGTILTLNPDSNRAITPTDLGEASSIAGVWLPRWESFRGLMANRDSWSLTPAGEIARANYDSSMNPQANCVPFSTPRIMVYPVHTKIEIFSEKVVARIDWIDAERTVYMDGRTHSEDIERSNQGHTIGWWEGDTLIMDTALFTKASMAGLGGFPSGPNKRVMERISLGDGGKTIEYSYVLEDPEYLNEPIIGSGVWDYHPDLEPSRIECDIDAAREYLENNN